MKKIFPPRFLFYRFISLIKSNLGSCSSILNRRWGFFGKYAALLPSLFLIHAMAEETSFEPESCADQLFRDLELVERIDQKENQSLPILINHRLQGGYFTMPSARTFQSGDASFGLAYAPPFHIWSLGFQLFDHLEVTGNYWTSTQKPIWNFPNELARTINAKAILLRREDGFDFLPDLALGMNDMIGDQGLFSFYAVATKQWTDWNLETTLGVGTGQIHGFYGGLAWTPFKSSKYAFRNLLLAAEYDANRYDALDTKVHFRVNLGAQLSLWDLFRFSVSSLRGNEVAAAGSFQYNFGNTKGLFPKIYDPPLYTSPLNTEKLGDLRTERELAQEFAYVFKEQGFDLYTLYLIPASHGKDHLWMKVINVRYWKEEEVRKRIQRVLASLMPSNVSQVTVVLESDGVSTYEYDFRSADLMALRQGKMGEEELRTIAPMREATPHPDSYESTLLYEKKKAIWTLTFRPWFRPFFGTNTGKFEYEVGALMGFEGYLFDQLYYRLNGTYAAKSSKQSLHQEETENPSRILNVRSDSLSYNQSNSLHVEEAFVQKSFNWQRGWFSRIALGYFESAYAGIAAETLLYPVYADWAVGLQGATVLKRKYFGLGFQDKVRRFTRNGEKFSRFIGYQYFLDLYYIYRPLSIDLKASFGQFLARDKGVRVDIGRSFASGLRIGGWYTLTNGKDIVNGSRYYDKGLSISMPLDFFLNKSSRSRIGYSLAARLRDVGAAALTGKPLYPTLYWDRYQSQ